MSRGPAYPLHTVLELRERDRDQAQEELATRLAAVVTAAQLVETRQVEVETASARVERATAALDLPPTDGSSLDVREMNRRRDEITWLRRELHAAEQRLSAARSDLVAAETAVETARAQLIETSQALTAIETHRDKWREEQRKEEERKEEAQMQEVALSAWVRAASESTEGSR